MYYFCFQLKIQEALKKKEKFHREHEEVSNWNNSMNLSCLF